MSQTKLLNGLAELHAATSEVNEAAENHEEADLSSVHASKIPIAELISYVPILIAALKLVKFLTGAKADEKIDKIIAWLKGFTV